jgi:hypothetical protein
VLAASTISTHSPDDEGNNTSETSVNFYQNTQRNNPEDSHLPISYIALSEQKLC